MDKIQYNCIIAAGSGYDTYINLIKYQEALGKIKIRGILSERKSAIGFDGYMTLLINDLPETDYDYLIITDTENYSEISKALSENFMIDREKIISSIAFRQPLFDFEKYVQLKESHITIISDDCTAALIYNRLGLEFSSPFILSLVCQSDYIKLVKNFRHYVELPLEEVVGWGGQNYPIGKIGDIEIRFPHSSDFIETNKSWKRRVARINYDNILFWMRCDTYDIAEQFQGADVERKIGFSPMKTEFPQVMWMSDLWIRYFDQMNGSFAYFMRSCVRSDISPLPFNLIDLLLDRSKINNRYKWENVQCDCQQERFAKSLYDNSYNNKMRLARMYTEGYIIPKDLDKAFLILLETNTQNTTNRQKCILRLCGSSNISSNVLSFRLASYFANTGDMAATALLARMYRDGKGVEKNLLMAREWMQKAADGGIVWAENELAGILLLTGDDEDAREAFAIRSKLAMRGDLTSMGLLARMYRDGKGVEKNLLMAREWMQKAADGGIVWAENELAGMI